MHWTRLRGAWFNYALISKVNSIQGNIWTKYFDQRKFTKVFPTVSISDAGNTLVDSIDDVGIH